MKKVKNQDTEE